MDQQNDEGIAQMSLAIQTESLDLDVFAVPSQTTTADRRSLLTIQSIVRTIVPHYVYLEVGSHLGGTLLPHLVDPLCRHAISVDSRPISQLDERGVMFNYTGNSTERMLDTLAVHVPPEALLKLTTHEVSLAELEPAKLEVSLAFIDAEHTNVAAFRDFLAARRFVGASAIIVFHDANLVFDALLSIELFLDHVGVKFRSTFLPENVFAIATGSFIDIACKTLEGIALDRDQYIHSSRIGLWRQIANNTALMEGDRIGRQEA